jgi:hypothetical protein
MIAFMGDRVRLWSLGDPLRAIAVVALVGTLLALLHG